VPAYNAARTIDKCLEALLDQSIPMSSYEIIVVDDGSTDDTVEIVQRYEPVHLLLSWPRKGAAAVRNIGANFARGDILLFTDADCIPAKAWIEEMTYPFADPNIAGVRGAYRTRQRELVARFVQIEYEDRYERIPDRECIDFVDTYSAAYRKVIFDREGGFDVRILIGEDIELSHRLARRGHKLVFAPKAIVYHHHVTSIWRYACRKWYTAFWRVTRYKMHPGFLIRDSHTPQVLKLQAFLGIVTVGTLPGAILVHQLAVWSVASSLLLVLSGAPFYLKAVRKDLAVGLLSPVMLFVRGIALGLGFAAGIVNQIIGSIKPGGIQLQRPGHWF